jgi:NADH:ubiquinone oxidoreductase subunit 5 (subunit L)/multisubunit Na+/H+ antiporter MnhA subunit
MHNVLFLALIAPFLGLAAVLALGGKLRVRVGWVALVAALTSAGGLASLLGSIAPGAPLVVSVDWIPSLDLGLHFMVDGLSLFFGLIVSGVGVLVVFYACFYLDDHYEYHARFYAYLLMFMAAMLITVFSADLLLLFIGWELTGITSFLLIGFLHGKEVSRDGARMALLVTASTGLAMLAGVVLLGREAGTYNLAVLLNGGLADADPAAVTGAFVLIALGAMGKSALFPFHFWLPNAMAAPTPVSAYLHSATMVKLGVFLVARIFPMFQGLELWVPLLVTVGFGTMLLAAVLALLSHDLKAVLAYSTVMQLSFLVGWYGLGGADGVRDDFLHIISHVFYKGCLFMVVGIIDHATHERDLRKLGGLARRMPLLLIITVIASASMAGLPGTTGFISKEYMLKGLFAFGEAGGWAWLPLVAAGLASVIKVVFSARLVWGVFGGAEPAAVAKHFHAPGLGIQMPPLLLAAAALVFGLLPGVLGTGLQHLAVPGLHESLTWKYSLWHGVTKELLTSAAIVALGFALYFLPGRLSWNRPVVPRGLLFEVPFEAFVAWLPRAAKQLTAALRSERPFDYAGVVFAFFLAVVGGFVLVHRETLAPGLPTGADFDPLRLLVTFLITLAVLLVVMAKRWTAQLIALSIIGFLLTFYFVLMRAPDLAMTQVLVETATLLLVLLLLARFPRSAEEGGGILERWGSRKVFNLVVALAVGGLTTVLSLMALRPRPYDPLGDFFLEATVPLAAGTNAVNTVLVDFRGFDTLMEVTVLLVATIGAMGLFMRYRRTAEERRAGAMGPPGFGLHPVARRSREEDRS